MAVNPLSFPIRTALSSVRSRSEPSTREFAVIDVPGMGFACVTADTNEIAILPERKPRLDDTTLRNEFCEVRISPITGGIESIHDFRTRGNRLSQQIAFRAPAKRGGTESVWRDPDQEAVYSIMVADSIDLDRVSNLESMVISQGRLVDREGRRLAGFVQRTSLLPGARTITLEVNLDIDEPPTEDPWNNYYCVRFAFPDAELRWSRGIGMERRPTVASRIESPLFVEAEASRWRTAIYTGGLPYHRRVMDRTLDTIVIVRGESERHFLLGIGIDSPQPIAGAWELVHVPTTWFADDAFPRENGSGWLYHIDARNVIATAWEPIEHGYRVRLRETLGSAGPVHLRSWRPIRSARQTDFLGNTLCELVVEHDKIWMEMNAYQWIQVEAVFQE